MGGLSGYLRWQRAVLKRDGYDYVEPPPHPHYQWLRSKTWVRWVGWSLLVAVVVVAVVLGIAAGGAGVVR
jgi:hypothetical protein